MSTGKDGGILGSLIMNARTELASALVQTIPSDDQIIMEHVRAAKVLLDSISLATTASWEMPEFKKEQYGATVATIKDDGQRERVEVLARQDGSFDLIVHNFNEAKNYWDDMSAVLTVKQMVQLGLLPTSIAMLRARSGEKE